MMHSANLPHTNNLKLGFDFFLCLLHLGRAVIVHLAAVLTDPPAVALPKLAIDLGRWAPSGKWYKLASVNTAMELPDGSLHEFLSGASRPNPHKNAAMEYVQQRGVWKQKQSNRAGAEWWIAFAGVGQAKPPFDKTAKEHTFVLGGAAGGEAAVTDDPTELGGNSTSSDEPHPMCQRCVCPT